MSLKNNVAATESYLLGYLHFVSSWLCTCKVEQLWNFPIWLPMERVVVFVSNQERLCVMWL